MTLIQWVDPTTGEASAGLSFGGLLVGTPSAAQSIEIWNDRDLTGADTARDLRLFALARRSASDDFVADGLPALDYRGIQVRTVSGLGSLEAQSTGWRALGASAWADLPSLASGQGLLLEVRVSLPFAAGTDSVTVRLRLDSSRSEALPSGVYEAAGGGVLTGLGDPASALIWSVSGAVVADGSMTLSLPDVSYVLRGRTWGRLAEQLALDTTDGDGATIVPGEAYPALVSLGSGALSVSKGSKGVAPITAPTLPATPTGEMPWFWVSVDSDGIEAPDVHLLSKPSGFGVASFAGDTLTLEPGQAFVDGHWVRLTASPQVIVPIDSTGTVWLQGAASVSVGVDPPQPRAEALAEVTADAVEITGVTDLRRFSGRRSPVSLEIGGTVGDSAVWVNPGGPLSLRSGPDAISLLALDGAVPAGGTSGAWVFEVESWDGSVWASWFPSSATDDRRPFVAFDGAAMTSDSWPEQPYVPRHGAIRTTIVSAPAGAAAGSGWALGFDLWESV